MWVVGEQRDAVAGGGPTPAPSGAFGNLPLPVWLLRELAEEELSMGEWMADLVVNGSVAAVKLFFGAATGLGTQIGTGIVIAP